MQLTYEAIYAQEDLSDEEKLTQAQSYAEQVRNRLIHASITGENANKIAYEVIEDPEVERRLQEEIVRRVALGEAVTNGDYSALDNRNPKLSVLYQAMRRDDQGCPLYRVDYLGPYFIPTPFGGDGSVVVLFSFDLVRREDGESAHTYPVNPRVLADVLKVVLREQTPQVSDSLMSLFPDLRKAPEQGVGNLIGG